MLTDDERDDAINILEHTRERHEKPMLIKGNLGKYMTPNFTESYVKDKGSKKNKERAVQLLCFPSFTLAPYSSQTPSTPPHLHPMRTLLQSSNSNTTKTRELQQAVCNLEHSRKGFCFHVSQIWCLNLNNGNVLSLR